MHAPEILEARIAPATLFAVDSTNNLLRFDSSSPDDIDDSIAISGLGVGESVLGIDFRPATSELYALSSGSRLYVVDYRTGAATVIGNAGGFTLNGNAFGFDFNPVPDRIRVTSDADQNLRLNPNDGTLAATDGALAYVAGDPNAGTNPTVVGSAYANNFVGTATTTLYGLDSALNILVTQNPPNNGSLNTVGPLGVDITNAAGFDIQTIDATQTAFAALQAGTTTALYSINLITGAAALVGPIGDGSALRGFTIAPSLVRLVNDTLVTFTDVDGDLVTVQVNRGSLSVGDLKLEIAQSGGSQLRELRLNDDGTEFDGANIAILSTRSGQGDGRVNVGYINATGHDLGAVRIEGDLGQIDAGDSIASSPALKSLGVISMGRLGTTLANVQSDILGRLGALTIKTDLAQAFINVSAGLDGDIGPVRIGGSLIGGGNDTSGAISASGDIGLVTIGGDVRGAAGNGSGALLASGHITGVTIGGSLLGSAGAGSGSLGAGAGCGPIKIGGEMRGGSGDETAQIEVTGELRGVSIGGSLIGGSGDFSGIVLGHGELGAVKIGRDLEGRSAFNSGVISTDGGNISSVKIKGSVIGSNDDRSGVITATGSLGVVRIGLNLVGGNGRAGGVEASGFIFGRTIGSLSIGGSIFSGSATGGSLVDSGAIRAEFGLGRLNVKGNVVGNSTLPVFITATGQEQPAAGVDLAIKKLSVGGRVEFANIFAGYDQSNVAVAVNPDAQIGAVKIGRDWIASNLVAGVNPVNGRFGDADDVAIAQTGEPDGFVSRIARVVIGGQVFGTPGVGDHFGFVAQHVALLQIGGVKVPLTPGPGNDVTGLPIGATSDVRVREVAA